MTAQRERIAGLKRLRRMASLDGEPTAKLDSLIAAEERILKQSREPGESRTVADLAADQEDGDEDSLVTIN